MTSLVTSSKKSLVRRDKYMIIFFYITYLCTNNNAHIVTHMVITLRISILVNTVFPIFAKFRQSVPKYIGKLWFWREKPPSPQNQCWNPLWLGQYLLKLRIVDISDLSSTIYVLSTLIVGGGGYLKCVRSFFPIFLELIVWIAINAYIRSFYLVKIR